MHPAIADFASEAFYEGRLQPVGLPHQEEVLPYRVFDAQHPIESLVATHRCAFINVPRPSLEERMPKANLLEAKIIAQLVKVIVSLYQRNELSFNPLHQLGIIVPFRRQIALVRTEVAKLLPDVAPDLVIDTVERYQGSQRDVIIYSLGVQNSTDLDFLTSNCFEEDGRVIDRKLNVAMTRARKQLLMTGNRDVLCRNAIFQELMQRYSV
jgi:superfamily I DNA and/or RNA helicase